MGATEDENEDLLLACRYGDIDDVRQFVETHGKGSLDLVRDGSGNSLLHMVAGNGHLDILDYLLPLVSPSLLSVQNSSGSTALHWAAINSQLAVAQKLIQHPGGPGGRLIDIKNATGRSPLAEAEMAGWDEGAKYMVQVMNIDETEAVEEEGENIGDSARDVEIEIQDADGQVAKMRISNGAES
ncbi:Ankyrin repeat-containing domain protein [Amanita muscaria]